MKKAAELNTIHTMAAIRPARRVSRASRHSPAINSRATPAMIASLHGRVINQINRTGSSTPALRSRPNELTTPIDVQRANAARAISTEDDSHSVVPILPARLRRTAAAMAIKQTSRARFVPIDSSAKKLG